MKFESNTNATNVFAEQLQNVIVLFEQWSDCERAVSLFAVLKKLTFPGTKFIQSVIETNLQQSQCLDQAKILERNANSAKYINGLSEIYRNFKFNDVQLTTDSIFYESDRSIDKLDKIYDKKKEILLDILKMMPILTIGNEEAKKAYLDFIPIIIKDAIRRIVNVVLVQQISSYLLIHPAFSTDDRKPLSEPLKDLENFIKCSSIDSNLDLYRNGTSPTSEPTKPSTPSNWQAIAPPQSKSTETISWGSNHHPTPVYTDDNDYHKTVGGSTPKLSHLYESSSDDHHISFSKNGEIVECDDDTDNKSNTQIGFTSLHNLTCNLHEFFNATDIKRRSSFPTTKIINDTNPKSRSCSVSGISSRHMTSGESDSLFDEYKSTLPPTHNVGMSNIGAWLKDLRLHKYTKLFTNRTYEQMLEITEEYLQEREVTQGARHKLVISIEKLKKRYSLLCEVEKNLLGNKIPISSAVDELKEIVQTPMKPIEPYNKQDVAAQFMKVLNMVSNMMNAKHIVPQDEEIVNKLIGILEKAAHNEAFVAHTNLIKEHRYKMQRIKSLLPPKPHRARRHLNQYQEFDYKLPHNRYDTRKTKSVPIVNPSRNAWFDRSNNLYNEHWSLPATSINATSNNSSTSQSNPLSKSIINRFGLSSAYNQNLDYSCSKNPFPEDTIRALFSKNAQRNSDAAKNSDATPTLQTMFQAFAPSTTTSYPFTSTNNSFTTASSPYTFVTNSYMTESNPFNSIKNPLTIAKNDEGIFKKPLPPPPPPRKKNLLSDPRSIESEASEGYHSDGFEVGMFNIPAWLKSHRLHKYTKFFYNLKYEKMFTFTEEYLVGMGVTKGASHKLATCIENLSNRLELLQQIESNLMENRVDLPDVLNDLRFIAVSPMKSMKYQNDDVGYQLLKVLNLAYKIFLSNNYDKKTITDFTWIIDRSMQNEAYFGHTHRNTIRNMKIEIGRRTRI